MEGKYTLVIGMPIGIVEKCQGTDGKNALVAFSSHCVFLSLHSTFFAHARPVPSRWSAHSPEPGAGVSETALSERAYCTVPLSTRHTANWLGFLRFHWSRTVRATLPRVSPAATNCGTLRAV